MKEKVKNIISVILPIVSIFIVGFIVKIQPTGFAVYEDKMLYKINGTISIELQDNIPVDSYVRIRIDDYEVRFSIIEFLEKSGGDYEIEMGFIMANGTYKADFDSLRIIQDFEKGKHVIRTEIVHKDLVMSSDEYIVEI